MKMNVSPVLISLVLVFASFLRSANSADPDPVTDFVTRLSTFTLRDIFKNGDVSNDSGGIRAATSTQNFPAVRTQGLSIVRFKMVPCGSNLPHTHPRASEVLSLLSGGPLQVGFVDTTGASKIDILYPGDLTVFPRGVLHFELNVGSVEADYLSALNSENPGTLTSSEALFRIPLRALATSLNVDDKTVTGLNSTVHRYGPGLKKTVNSGCVPGRDITTSF
jgi:mannose-6-phosphate isomerase-like protein (cupin superfamily)